MRTKTGKLGGIEELRPVSYGEWTGKLETKTGKLGGIEDYDR
jgi:hypothetical protein